MSRGLSLLQILLAVLCTAQAQTAIDLHLTFTDEVPWLATSAHPGRLLRLEHSGNLRDWTETARVFEQLHSYGDWFRDGVRSGFYRVHSAPLQPADDWSNLIVGSSRALFMPGSGSGLAGTSFVKWSLLLTHPDRVYFQDSVRYPFHIQFARARLPGYGSTKPKRHRIPADPTRRRTIGGNCS